MPSSTRTKVVLPAPLGPIRVTISPALTSMSTSCSRLRPARITPMPRAPMSSPEGRRSGRLPGPTLAPGAAEDTTPFQARGAWECLPLGVGVCRGRRSRPSMIWLLRRLGTIGAQAPHLYHRLLGRKRNLSRRFVDRLEHAIGVDLGHPPAAFAGEHQLAARVAGVAGKKGIAALEPVHDPDPDQRVDRPVDRNRCQPLAARLANTS